MDRFAETCEEIAKYSSRLRKVQILGEYLRGLPDAEYVLAVRFLSTGPVAESARSQTLFEMGGEVKLSVGHSALRDALHRVTGWDHSTLRVCYREVGDTGETIGLLLRGHSRELPLSLEQTNQIYQDLFHAGTTAKKVQILSEAFSTYRPLAIKYLAKVITRNLRIGLMERQVEEAIAASCNLDPALVRQANNLSGDLPRVALTARRGELHSVDARLFHPMDFMLAKPLDRVSSIETPSEWAIEDKFDGIRSHVHVDHDEVRIYSRGLEDVTHSFPELVEGFTRAGIKGIFDGEILAWRDNRPLSFNILQQRLARKQVQQKLRTAVPVVFMAYDLLFAGSELLLDRSFVERRRRLEAALPKHSSLLLSNLYTAETREQIEQLFLESRSRGNEGLLLKRRDSRYEPSKRTGSWYKLKQVFGTLDVVITAAEQGHGKRATLLSDYTFAVRSGDQFVNIGKAYSGLTDGEVKELTRILRAASVDRFGRVVLVRPEVVLEVAFDGVQKSARHKSGYALRFPRILRWRKDKSASGADNLARVEQLYESSLG